MTTDFHNVDQMAYKLMQIEHQRLNLMKGNLIISKII